MIKVKQVKNMQGSASSLLWVAFILALGLLLTGCQTHGAVVPDQGLIEPGLVTVQEAYQLREEGAFVLDVRTPGEWQEGHIPNAVLIPLDELESRADELPQEGPILIYCRSGNRSLQALNLLAGKGFTDLYSMNGGITDWIAAGFPVTVE